MKTRLGNVKTIQVRSTSKRCYIS